MHRGWIKLHRKLLENPVVCKDGDYLAVWIHLLLNATSKEMDVEFGGSTITLKPGQLITGRKAIGEKYNINEHKVDRILKRLKVEQQIEQQSSSRGRLITILAWSEYQSCKQQNEQQVSNERATSEQQVSTNKNVKEYKNVKEDVYCPAEAEQIVAYMNKKWGTNYRPTTRATVSLIQARLNEGFTTEDFIRVIDNQTAEWKHDSKMKKFLRPQTLFSGKFESYLNSEVSDEAEKKRLAEEAGEIMEKGGTVW